MKYIEVDKRRRRTTSSTFTKISIQYIQGNRQQLLLVPVPLDDIVINESVKTGDQEAHERKKVINALGTMCRGLLPHISNEVKI